MGSGTGITQFDDEQWRKYLAPNSTRVRALAHWKNNNIYAATMNHLGVYQPDDSGRLVDQSLIADWPAEKHQFGEVWSVAANQEGVAYVSNRRLYFRYGLQMHSVQGAAGSKHRIFSLDNACIYKSEKRI